MWLWWVVLLPKGVSRQFISLLYMRVCVSVCSPCVLPALGSLANSMAEEQLYHYSNMESLWPCMVSLQLIHKFDHNRQTFFFKNVDDYLVVPGFLGYINLKRWRNFTPVWFACTTHTMQYMHSR